jgi:hypothetical protein
MTVHLKLAELAAAVRVGASELPLYHAHMLADHAGWPPSPIGAAAL